MDYLDYGFMGVFGFDCQSGAECAHHDRVVSLVGLEGQLQLGFEAVFLEAVDLLLEHDFRLESGVNAVGLDRDHEMPPILKKALTVFGNDAGLVRLRHIREHSIDHSEQESIVHGLAGVMDDRDNVGPLLGHVDEVAARAVRELDRVDDAGLSDQVADMADRGARAGAQVEHLVARLDVDVLDAAQHCGRDLGPEGVPDPVLDLLLVVGHAHPLLVVDALPGGHVLCADGLLPAHRQQVDARQPVRLDHHPHARPRLVEPPRLASPKPPAPAAPSLKILAHQQPKQYLHPWAIQTPRPDPTPPPPRRSPSLSSNPCRSTNSTSAEGPPSPALCRCSDISMSPVGWLARLTM
jgi:hypothetical protein